MDLKFLKRKNNKSNVPSPENLMRNYIGVNYHEEIWVEHLHHHCKKKEKSMYVTLAKVFFTSKF
jgi:hypothetical protein